MSQSQGSGWGAPPPGQQQGTQPPGSWAPPPPPNQQGWPSKYCQSCGASIDSRAEICPNCGVRQSSAVTGETKSRPIAILLALFLGTFGVHRFYVGPISWGIAYLVFFWTGVPGFLAWLEAIYWLTRSNEEWAQKYGGQVQQPNGAAIGCLWILALLPFLAIGAIVLLVLLGGGIATVLDEIAVGIETGS